MLSHQFDSALSIHLVHVSVQGSDLMMSM